MNRFITGILLIVSSFISYSQPIEKSYLLGKFDPAKDNRFVQLGLKHASGNGLNAYLRKEALAAFGRMQNAAQKDGVALIIVSATRNFDQQKVIWENKWNGNTLVEGRNISQIESEEKTRLIMRYSSMPGTSRHHWGTDIDLNSVENSYWKSGNGLKIYSWLKTHAPEFGFYQPYTNKSATKRLGYEEEEWHWSYQPLSEYFLKEFISKITYADLTGFKGFENAEAVKAIDSYVKGVSCSEK